MAHGWSAMVDINQSCAASDVVSSRLERDRSQASMEAKVHVPARHHKGPLVGKWACGVQAIAPRSCYSVLTCTHLFHTKNKGSGENSTSKLGFLGLISKICKIERKYSLIDIERRHFSKYTAYSFLLQSPLNTLLIAPFIYKRQTILNNKILYDIQPDFQCHLPMNISFTVSSVSTHLNNFRTRSPSRLNTAMLTPSSLSFGRCCCRNSHTIVITQHEARTIGCNVLTPFACAMAPTANGKAAEPEPPMAVANPMALMWRERGKTLVMRTTAVGYIGPVVRLVYMYI